MRLAVVVMLIASAFTLSNSRNVVVAAGTWVNRSASAVLDIAIQDGGSKYFVARGDRVYTPDQWGTNVATMSSYSLAGVSIAVNPAGTHCITGETGSSITVRYSTNSCQSWAPKTLISGTTGSVDAVAISDSGARMYAITSTGALFASSNTGNTFTQQPQTESWTDIAVNSAGTTVIASTSDGQILRSTDSGSTMTQVLTNASIGINAIASSGDGTIVVAGDQNGVLKKSTNSAQTWTSLTIPNNGNLPIADVAMSADGSKILAAIFGGKLIRSTDGGSNWTEEDSARNWTAVAVSPSGTHMGAGTASHYYTSSLSLDVSSSTPARAATGILNDANIVLNFNNKISLVSAKNFYLKKSSDNSIVETIPIGDPRLLTSVVGTLTVDPTTTLQLGTSYYLDSDNGAVVDEHGNTWDKSSWVTQFTTSATDSVAPTVKSRSPINQGDRTQTTQNLTITFNEDVQVAAGKYIQLCYVASLYGCTFNTERFLATDSSKVTVSGSTVTFNPETEFPVNSTFYLRIEQGAFTDLNGNAFAGIATDTFPFYTVAIDGRAPIFRKACTTTNGQSINLLYDEDLVSGTLTKSNFTVTVGGVSQSISSVTVPGNAAHVVIALASPIGAQDIPLVSYSAASSTVRDSNSNASIALSNVNGASRDDCAGPSLSEFFPTQGATGVPTNSRISVTFNEPVRTEFGKSLTVYNNTSNAVIESISSTSNQVSVVGNTLTIRTTGLLPANSEISLYALPNGFVEDISGNDVWGWENRNFYRFNTGTGADLSAPAAPSVPVLDSSSDSGVSSQDRTTRDSTPTLNVVAQENGGIVTITATKSGQSNVVCAVSASTTGGACTLSSLADGEWTVEAVHEDLFGNVSSQSAGVIITIDTSSPLLVGVSPGTNATNVLATSDLQLTFSESVERGSGSLFLSSGVSCSSTVQTFSSSSNSVGIANSIVTINPAVDFVDATSYCVTYPVGFFVDTAGNGVDAMTASSSGRIAFSTQNSSTTTTPVAPASPTTTTTTTPAATSTTSFPTTTTTTPFVSTNDGDSEAVISGDLTIAGTSGTAVASDGSTFAVGKSGAVTLKLWTGYIGSASGLVRASFKVGSTTKKWSCTIRSVKIDKVNKNAKRTSNGWFPKKFKVVKNSCVLPMQLRTMMKTQKVVLSARVRFVKQWPTTGKAINPVTGARIPVGIRNLRISIGR